MGGTIGWLGRATARPSFSYISWDPPKLDPPKLLFWWMFIGLIHSQGTILSSIAGGSSFGGMFIGLIHCQGTILLIIAGIHQNCYFAKA